MKPTTDFSCIRLEGGLVTPELLRSVHARNSAHQEPTNYDLPSDARVIDEVREHWDRLRRHWAQWKAKSWQQGQPPTGVNADNSGGGTRDQWQLPLLRALGFHNLTANPGLEVNGRRFPIARAFIANDNVRVPIHLVGAGVALDKRTAGVAGAATDRPHAHVQAYLNEDPRALWGIVSDGLVLRLLRDTTSLSRAPFIEFDLVRIFEGDDFAGFALLWLLCHATRFVGDHPSDCPLEKWSLKAANEGTRALASLHGGVEKAIETLGDGFLSHPANRALAKAVHDGDLGKQQLFHEVLRIIYRIIFVLVAEERDVLHASNASPAARELYAKGYALSRVRGLALSGVRGSAHGDLWRASSVAFARLAEDGADELGINALGSFLFLPSSTPHLVGAGTFTDPSSAARHELASFRVELSNRAFLDAMRSLCGTIDSVTKKHRAVDFRSLGAEELGSVYEGLLELHLDSASWPGKFKLETSAGNERKTSGSYYTPDSLVQCLLDSALEPVIKEAVKGKKGADAAEAILNLKVCDPAVGSGHFLIAAAHRLAKHVARARALDSEPTPDEHRTALREVIRRCMYGVDINPMSAELCKVALWMESMEPGKPLSFLDSHIQVGNSLIGATPELLAEGIPEGAFECVEGDVKTEVSALKKKNKKELQDRKTGQSMLNFTSAAASDLGSPFAAVTQGEDLDAATVVHRAQVFAALKDDPAYRHAKLLADAWCAAFFWRKDGVTIGGIRGITDGILREIEEHPDRFPIGNPIRNEIERLARVHQFLHWHVAIPDVFDGAHALGAAAPSVRSGFDCILGNPPWERVKLQEKEWFAQRVPDIANAPNAAARGRMIKALEKERPELFTEFLGDVRAAEGASTFMRNSGRYPLCGRGDVNLYTVFAESMRDGVSPIGRVGCIVPSGVATDDTTKFFFQDLVDRASLASLFDFENREGLFEAVDSRMKFSCLTLRAPAPDAKTAALAPAAEFVFFAHKVEDLTDERRRFTLTRDEIALVNPNTKTCPIFRTKVDAELTKYIYRRVPVLVKEATDTTPEENPWGVEFTRLFDMSNDSGLFRTREQLEKDGWRLRGTVFERGAEKYLPLYEAKMVHHYDHRWATYEGLETRDVSDGAKQDAERQILSRYWLPIATVASSTPVAWKRPWLMGWRDVCRSTDARTIIAAPIPHVAVGDKYLLRFPSAPGCDLLSHLADTASFAHDFVARQKLGGTAAKYFVVRQLPHIPPSNAPRGASGIEAMAVAARTLELSATADDMSPFSRDLWPEGDGAVFRYDPERRLEIRCELDAAFFHLYLGTADDWRAKASPELLKSLPTPRDAVAYIMETFPIVKKKDMAAHGVYRTKDRILALYDQLQSCLATNTPFVSALTPPPGPPTNADGSFAKLPAWRKGAPQPRDYPSHIHPPVSHRS